LIYYHKSQLELLGAGSRLKQQGRFGRTRTPAQSKDERDATTRKRGYAVNQCCFLERERKLKWFYKWELN